MRTDINLLLDQSDYNNPLGVVVEKDQEEIWTLTEEGESVSDFLFGKVRPGAIKLIMLIIFWLAVVATIFYMGRWYEKIQIQKVLFKSTLNQLMVTPEVLGSSNL